MGRWKWCHGVIAVGAVMAALAGVAAPAAAQQAPARVAAPAPAEPAAQKPVFRPRDLMTPEERANYRQQMRAARENVAERQQIRDRMTATLRQRATERGGVLWTPGMARPAQKEANANREPRPEPARPAPPPRAP